MEFEKKLKSARLLPIITLKNDQQIKNVKRVLEKSDIELVEVAYRSDMASIAIKDFSSIENVIVGAGTIRTLDQAKEAVENGAKFLVSPGYDDSIVNFANDNNIPITPGVLTPTEIMHGINKGNISIFKIFPANLIGGLSGINALKGPFFDIKFLPTGGVNTSNFEEFLKVDSIIAVGGSFILDENIDENHIDEEVTRVNELVNKAKKFF